MLTLVRQLASLMTTKERRRIVVLLAMMCVGAALEVVGVGAVPAFLLVLNDPSRVGRLGILRAVGVHVEGMPAVTLALVCAAVLLVLFVVKNAYLAAQAFAQTAFARDLQIRLAYRMLDGYLSSPYEAHLQRNSADAQGNANSEAVEVVSGVMMPVMTLTMNALVALAIMGLLLSAAPITALSAFAFVGAVALAIVHGTRSRLSRHGALMQGCWLDMVRVVNESLGS